MIIVALRIFPDSLIRGSAGPVDIKKIRRGTPASQYAPENSEGTKLNHESTF